MASVDMCEHDWPGTGCRQCFPKHQEKQMNIDSIIETIEKLKPRVSEDLLGAYCGTDEEAEFSDWASGNFEDDVELGVRLGHFLACEEIIDVLMKMKGEVK